MSNSEALVAEPTAADALAMNAVVGAEPTILVAEAEAVVTTEANTNANANGNGNGNGNGNSIDAGNREEVEAIAEAKEDAFEKEEESNEEEEGIITDFNAVDIEGVEEILAADAGARKNEIEEAAEAAALETEVKEEEIAEAKEEDPDPVEATKVKPERQFKTPLNITSNVVDPRQGEWDIMVNLIGLNEHGLDAMTNAGILNIGDVELFGSGAAADNPLTAASIDGTGTVVGMNPMMRQKFQILATYLLNGGKLTTASNMADMARFNLLQTRSNSNNQSQLEDDDDDDEQDIAVDETLSSGAAKRGRGRPRKSPAVRTPPKAKKTSVSASKRPRGRPRKSPAAEPAAASTPSSGKRSVGRPRKDGASPMPPSSTGKRSRGRPRKAPVPDDDEDNDDEEADVDASAAAPVAKRPRGRPRKNAVVDYGENEGSNEEEEDETNNEDDAAGSEGQDDGDDGNAGEEDDDDMDVPVTSLKMDTPAVTAAAAVKGSTETYRGPPTTPADKLGPENNNAWPDGWTQVSVERPLGKGRQMDTYWYSPGGKKMRSTVEVRKFLKALLNPEVAGDEAAAWKIFKSIELV